MFTITKNPPRSGAAETKPETPDTEPSGAVPTYDPFNDDELWRRVGEVIARTGRRQFWPGP